MRMETTDLQTGHMLNPLQQTASTGQASTSRERSASYLITCALPLKKQELQLSVRSFLPDHP